MAQPNEKALKFIKLQFNFFILIMKKLNLGCGKFPKENYINIDIDPAAKADIFHDLSIIPYPFENKTFDLIEMSHILEHLPNTLDVMMELHRILKPGARLIIKVPPFFTWVYSLGS